MSNNLNAATETKQKLSFLNDLGLDEDKVSEELISKVMTAIKQRGSNVSAVSAKIRQRAEKKKEARDGARKKKVPLESIPEEKRCLSADQIQDVIDALKAEAASLTAKAKRERQAIAEAKRSARNAPPARSAAAVTSMVDAPASACNSMSSVLSGSSVSKTTVSHVSKVSSVRSLRSELSLTAAQKWGKYAYPTPFKRLQQDFGPSIRSPCDWGMDGNLLGYMITNAKEANATVQVHENKNKL